MISLLLLLPIDFPRNWQQNLAMNENQTAGHVTIETRRLPIPGGVAVFSLFDSEAKLKAHPAYVAAKADDSKSALALIADIALAEIYRSKNRFGSDSIFVAPFAREASGDNAISQVLSEVFAALCGASADKDIVQVTKVYHTGADPMERLALRPEFEGAVKIGGRYVLVDDVISLGGTLAELSHYIQRNGGIVQDVAVIVNAGRNKSLRPDAKTLKTLKQRYANEIIEIFGIHVDDLTANKAQYLVGFRSAEEIRNRLLKAQQEVDLRLRSKGIEGVFGAQDS